MTTADEFGRFRAGLEVLLRLADEDLTAHGRDRVRLALERYFEEDVPLHVEMSNVTSGFYELRPGRAMDLARRIVDLLQSANDENAEWAVELRAMADERLKRRPGDSVEP